MYSLAQLEPLLKDAITKLSLPESPIELYDPIRYILSLGGKRTRPSLVLMSCDLFDGDIQEATNAALAIEVFHNFTLLHDDIMDNAPLRRGNATVHTKWNNNTAILSGDVMLVEAYKLISTVKENILGEVLRVFNNTAAGVCEGQQYDMNFEIRDTVKIEEYLKMIEQKTAILLGTSLKIGAIIAGTDKSNADAIEHFGNNLGIAFQLQDDILDVYGDPEKFGKQIGGDILANKKTFLLIKALEHAKDNTQETLVKWISSTDFNPKEKVDAVTRIYNELGIKEIAKKAMLTYADKAMSYLESITVENHKKDFLKAFVLQLTNREY